MSGAGPARPHRIRGLQMTSFRHRLAAIFDRLLLLGDGMIVLSSLAFLVLIVAQVFCRYVLQSSLVWAEEAVRLLLYFTVVTGMGPTAVRGASIALDGIDKLVPEILRLPMALAKDAVTIAFCCCFLWFSAQLIGRSWIARTPFMGLPMASVYILGLPGVVLCLLGTIRPYLAPIVQRGERHLQDMAT